MTNSSLKTYLVALAGVGMALTNASVQAADEEKRCTAGGVKVVCPTKSDAEVKKAADAYSKEASNYERGKGGSTYGVAPFDYLTGVGKRANTNKNTYETSSGYGTAGGSYKTELWDRVRKPVAGAGVYDQWTHNWSPKFDSTLVPGADPNQGKTYYYSYCIACHGWMMHGDGPSAAELNPRPRTLTRGEYMNKKTNLELFAVIKGGGEAVSLSSSMPNWGNVLQDQDIWNIIAFIRTMQDVAPPKSVAEYLAPKSTFKPIKGDVDALSAATRKEFKEMQEMIESDMAGRGGNVLVGGGFVEGGNRVKAADVTLKVK